MYFDYHVHTAFSDDSVYPMEDVVRDAVALGIEELAFTDHVDYGVKDEWDCPNPRINYDGDIAVNVDYPRYFARIAELAEAYAGRIRLRAGLEFGVQSHRLGAYEQLFAAWPLDFVLLSIHQVRDIEFWYPHNPFTEGRTQKEYNDAYYEELYRCVCGYRDYSVLAHLDHIRRYDPAGSYPTEKNRDIIAAILERVIEDGKGIEVNTSCFRYALGDLTPSTDIIELYRDLGGTIVTVGSDSHAPSHLGTHVPEVYDRLRALGFSHIVTYDRMQPAFHAL